MEEELADEYYVDLFAEIADSEPITEAIDEVCRPPSLLLFLVLLRLPHTCWCCLKINIFVFFNSDSSPFICVCVD